MRYANNFLVTRYTVFGFFTICNAVICSVAAWNFGILRSTRPYYLIFLGGFSLASIITLAFVELLCVNPFTTRVWFEVAWVTLFWAMELAGGAALIAIESELPCSRLPSTLCASAHVVLAFTWMCAIILLVYLLVLVFTVASQYHANVKIWVSDVRTLAAQRCSLALPHSSPATRFEKSIHVDNYTSAPLRSPPTKIRHHLGGLGPEYQIDPYLPVFAIPEQKDITHLSNLPEAIPLPPLAAARVVPSYMKSIPSFPRDVVNPHSLLGLSNTPQEHVTYRSANFPSAPIPMQSNTLASPSPLGDWPRQDAMKQPIKHKRKSPPPSAFEFPKDHTASVGSTDKAPENVAQPRPRRPSGPRSRVPSEEGGHRPARLNLSGISNYEAGRRIDDAAR